MEDFEHFLGISEAPIKSYLDVKGVRNWISYGKHQFNGGLVGQSIQFLGIQQWIAFPPSTPKAVTFSNHWTLAFGRCWTQEDPRWWPFWRPCNLKTSLLEKLRETWDLSSNIWGSSVYRQVRCLLTSSKGSTKNSGQKKQGGRFHLKKGKNFLMVTAAWHWSNQ